MREIYNRCMELSYLWGVKILKLVDRTDLFKISNLVYGGRESVLSVYSRRTVYGGYGELVGTEKNTLWRV
jgi:hypothetical protein